MFFVVSSNYGQCAYPSSASSVGSYSFCIGRSSTNPIVSANVSSGNYITLDVISGFVYNFSVPNAFTGNENLTLFNADTNTNFGSLGYSSGGSGTSFDWLSTISGRIKILLTNGNCATNASGSRAITITLKSVGNNFDDQSAYGTNNWIGHIYTAGGEMPTTFTANKYLGYYRINSESINENFGGSTNCFSFMSNSVNRAQVYTEGFAVRYRMKTTKSGCYVITVSADDGIRLYLNGTNILDRWVEQSSTTYSNVVVNLDGDDDLVFDYYENGDANTVTFSIAPFDAGTNTITAPGTVDFCGNGTPGQITGSLQYSSGDSNLQNPQLSFQWQSSTDGVTFNNINGATLRNYTPPTITAPNIFYYRRLVSINGISSGCSYSPSNIVRITASSNSAPTFTGNTMTGATNQCALATGQVYSVVATNATSYIWSVPSGWTITSGQGTNSITVTIGTAGGSVSVTAANGCNKNASISKTITVNQNPTANAGTAVAAICQGATSAAMGGSVGGGATGGTWTTSGSGTWTNATSPSGATYTAGASESGNITLTLTTTGGSCGNATITKTITVNPKPIANAGTTLAAICQGATSAAMGGSIGGGATAGKWSGGAGTWSNDTDPSGATYTAGASESGNITLTLTTSGGSCNVATASKIITVNAKPTANVGTAVAAICQGATSAAMGGSIGGGATGGTWSGGSGTWNNATSPSGATYTAGASESGNITLTLTATGVSCSPAIVTKTITVNPKPTVANAGADQYGNGAFTLAANVPTAGTGTWSIASGPSTALTQFSNVNAANATFTPLGAGVYTLNWTITTASCGSSTDDVVLSNCVGNLVQNGDFSNGANNWSKATTKGTKVEVLKENVYFPNGNSENYTAELDVEASLGQTVSVIPNVPYTLSFIYARRPGSSPTVAVDVKIIDGSNTITRNYTTSDTTNSSVFQTIQFTPSTSSIWIEFYNSLETTTLGSIVDNIVLLPTSQVNPVATTTPKGKFKTVDACNGASVQLDVENVPASGVSYSWTTTSTGVTFSQNDIKNPKITVTGTGIKNATVVVTTAGGCSSVSSTTYVNVLALPVAGLVSNDADNTFCEGTSVTFTASGGTSYAFKVGSTTVQSGASDTYTTTALTNGQTVTVDVTNASGCTSTSAGITNTVTPNNTITLTSAAGTDSQTVCANTAITNITYSTNGATGVNFGILPAGISGIWSGNVATISGTPTVNSTNSYNYTITLTGGCGTITATGTINVDSLPVGGSIAGGTTVCSGTGDTVLTLSGNSGIVAHWESSLDNFATAGTVINNTSTTLTVSNLTATTSYRAVITNGVCASINSATATITVKPLPTTPTITKNNNVSCGGFGIITLTDLPADWTINQTGLTTGSRSFSGTDSSVPIQNLTIDTYSFTVKDNATGCTSNAATVSITDESSITEWTDSGWSNGEPDGSKSVVIKSVAVDQPFKSNKPNVVACSLIIDVPTTGPDVEIPSNVTLRITNIVKSNGKLVFKSGSSLVQKNNVQNEGDIVYIRATDVRRFDLTYWSSPIKSTKPEGFRMQDLSPTTYFDKFLYWSSEYKWATNLYGTLPMEVGKGYSIRGPQEFDNVDGGTFEGKFIGVPNNGNIDVTGVAVDKYFFLGNPYPSPIDVEKLWDANPDVLGPLYFWIHALLPQKAPGDNTARYSSNDYIICTAAGSTDINGETAPKSFDGFIAAGQGFFAKPKTTVIHFNNDMREGATENTNFFKTAKSASIERNRIWLNIRNTEGAFKQILVGYIQGATNSVDFNYDAATLGANSFIDFYSINETKKLTIQGRALPFDDTDVVPLGYKSTIDSDFTIAIDHADGFFDKQEVYLEDKITGKIINLRNENYTFSTLAGTFADRFVLRYTNKTLGTGDFENIEDSVLISVKNKVVSITSSKETIKDVNIFNVGAQLMYSKNKVNSSELQINNLHSSDQVLLVKVTLENGSTVSKKVVFSNLP
ncbi:hypothetical protein GCM10022422_42140 [Flavobacterium ginsengisoli]|uniref:PA14 domain-containing protein n=2 Tax=Flavobacterium ginsengisoli TaxID=871694 RepID=A0ABP7G1F3_9FLAO